MQKVGGYNGLVIGVQFIVILVIAFGILGPQGVTPGTPPDQILAVAAQSATPFLIQNLVVASFSVTVVLGALALRERLQAGAPNRMRVAVIAASVASALFLAAGIIPFRGLPAIVAANDLAAFRVLEAVTQGLLTSGIFATGWTLLLWGWAGLSTKGLPTVLNYILLLAGVAALLAFAIPIFGLLAVVINVVWAFWLGYVLLAQPVTMGMQSKPTM